MNLDLDLTSYNGGGGGMLMECNMRSVAEKRSKTYEDPASMVSSSFCCLRHQESELLHIIFLFSFRFQKRGPSLRGRQTCWPRADCWTSP